MTKLFQLFLVAPMLAFLALACAPVAEGVVSGAAEATTEEVLDSFDIFDDDQSGDIDHTEFDNNASQFDTETEFDDLDTDRDGFVTEEEFEAFEEQ